MSVSVLWKRKESRRRSLQIHLPTATPLAPQLRLVQSDSSYVSMQEIFEDFAASKKMAREDTVLTYFDRIKELHDPAIPRVRICGSNKESELTIGQNDHRYIQLRAELMEEIRVKMVPETIITNVRNPKTARRE